MNAFLKEAIQNIRGLLQVEGIKPVGIFTVGCDTFNIPYTEEISDTVWKSLKNLNIIIVGAKKLMFDEIQIMQVPKEFEAHDLDIFFQLQITFNDASLTLKITRKLDTSLLIRSFPETLSGGLPEAQLFCGINQAVHTLSREHLSHDSVHNSSDNENTLTKIVTFAKLDTLKAYKTMKQLIAQQCNYPYLLEGFMMYG